VALLRVWVRRALIALPTALAALVVTGGGNSVSPLWPWNPHLADFEVYYRTGVLVLQGKDIFATDGLPWVYPPFAALPAAGMALLPYPVVTAAWALLGAAALLAVLYRLGLGGSQLALAGVLSVVFVAPVTQTFSFGQLGILLVAAAVLDSMPGRRLLKRRLLPEGWLTGLATAVKLTPAVIAAANFVSGRRRPAWTALVAFVVATATGLLLWNDSLHYWGGLIRGDTGTNSGLIYAANQSVLAMAVRLSRHSTMGWVWLSVLVLALGLWAAALWHRRGQARFALVLAGLTGLLASPISWSHHYVWVVPLVIVLWQERRLPAVLRWFGQGYAVWIIAAPFMALPMGADLEFSYDWWELLVDDAGIVAGVVFVILAVVTALRSRNSASATIVESGELNFAETLVDKEKER
jgi:alpha-1,2-mannosyltransferase